MLREPFSSRPAAGVQLRSGSLNWRGSPLCSSPTGESRFTLEGIVLSYGFHSPAPYPTSVSRALAGAAEALNLSSRPLRSYP